MTIREKMREKILERSTELKRLDQGEILMPASSYPRQYDVEAEPFISYADSWFRHPDQDKYPNVTDYLIDDVARQIAEFIDEICKDPSTKSFTGKINQVGFYKPEKRFGDAIKVQFFYSRNL